jgi:chromosome segregation ATPase
MADDPEKNVLDYLREQFARVHLRLDDMAQWQAETTRRLTSIERHIAAVRRDAVLDAESLVNTQDQLDTLTGRIARIERRLDLADAPS